MADRPASALTLADLWRILSRHRLLALGAGTAVAAAVILGSFLTVPMYEAQASLAVDRGRKAVSFAEDVGESGGRIETALLNTQRDLILSWPVLSRTIADARLDQERAYAGATEPTAVLARRMVVTTARDSWTVGLALRHESPEVAQRALEALIKAFIDRQREQAQARSADALGFLSRQVADARTKLDEARDRETRFRREQGILSSDPEHNLLTVHLEHLVQDRSAVARLEAEAAVVKRQVEALAAGKDDQATIERMLEIPDVGRDPVVMEQIKALAELLPQRQILIERYKGKHPRILEIDESIAAHRRQIAWSVAMARAAISIRLIQVQGTGTSLDRQIDQGKQQLAEYRDRLLELKVLSDESTSRESLYRQLLNRLMEEEVASRLQVSSLAVVEPARAGSTPVNIRRSLSLAAGLLAGLVAALGAALAGEALARRLRGVEDVLPLTRTPVVGQIPFVPGLTALGRDGDPESWPALAEAYRAVRATVRLLRPAQERAQVLLVTSAQAGDGKSTTAVWLATALAAAGRTVLLIDADLRRPTLHEALGEGNERGLSNLLAGEAGIEPVDTLRPGLRLLASGPRVPRPAELLHRPALAELLARTRAERTADYVILDTPPVGLVADAVELAELADGILVVVRDRLTTKNALRNALERLSPYDSRMLGILFNAEVKPRGGGSYGYNAYRAGSQAALAD